MKKPAMALKPSFSVTVLFLSLFVLCFALALSTQDPELEQCQHQCKHQVRFTATQKVECIKRCEDYIAQKEELEQAKKQPPKKHLEEDKLEPRREVLERACMVLCKEEHSERAQRHCEKECLAEFSREWHNGKKKHKKEEEEEEEEENPYVFGDEHFTTTHETEQGRISLLHKFTDRSELLRGVENFRLVVLEANPQTFIVPAHFDADCLLFVAKGRASVTMVRNKKQSFNLERGDIFTIPAGTQAYMTNRDESEQLFIIKLLQPVALPGHFEAFRGTGGDNPESYYTAFSWDVLEAAFNTGRESLKKVFGQRREGGIIKATKQQIRALRPSFLQHGVWPFGTDPNAPFNLLKQRPTQSNKFGKLFEARSEDCSPLQDLDVTVAYADITNGAMVAPYYNSRATKIAFVVDGEGWLEMACPHISSSSSGNGHEKGHEKGQVQGQGERFFENMSAPLRKGTAFVVPAGHPVVTVASGTENLRILCFEVNAKGNIRFPLAGKNNVVSLMDKEAKELSFNMPAAEVDRVFRSQNGEFFFPGPKEGHEIEHSSMRQLEQDGGF